MAFTGAGTRRCTLRSWPTPPSPRSPDLVYEQEAGAGNKRVSFGHLVTDPDRGSAGVPSYLESTEYADIPLAQNGKYIS